jgi:hypothetical protein
MLNLANEFENTVLLFLVVQVLNTVVPCAPPCTFVRCEYKEDHVERDQHHVDHEWRVEQSDAMLIL